MRRADRLFRIVQFLRAGRLITAQRLAEKLEVSRRTVYRDVRDLQLSGMPIEGEAGVGYTLRREFDLPPMMFTRSELTALVLGTRMVRAWGGFESSMAAKQALQRIEAVLPPDLRDRLDSIAMYAPAFQMSHPLRMRLDLLHEACVERHAVAFHYLDLSGAQTQDRVVRPLALYFWRGVWTLASWCELRNNFRVFRVDRWRFDKSLKRILKSLPARRSRITCVKSFGATPKSQPESKPTARPQRSWMAWGFRRSGRRRSPLPDPEQSPARRLERLPAG